MHQESALVSTPEASGDNEGTSTGAGVSSGEASAGAANDDSGPGRSSKKFYSRVQHEDPLTAADEETTLRMLTKRHQRASTASEFWSIKGNSSLRARTSGFNVHGWAPNGQFLPEQGPFVTEEAPADAPPQCVFLDQPLASLTVAGLRRFHGTSQPLPL